MCLKVRWARSHPPQSVPRARWGLSVPSVRWVPVRPHLSVRWGQPCLRCPWAQWGRSLRLLQRPLVQSDQPCLWPLLAPWGQWLPHPLVRSVRLHPMRPPGQWDRRLDQEAPLRRLAQLDPRSAPPVQWVQLVPRLA